MSTIWMSTIPAGRSPYVNNDQLNVNTVVGSGYFEGYACWSSCGKHDSPTLNFDDYASCVRSDGSVIGGSWNGYVTNSYGKANSPDLHPDEMISFAVMRNGMTWGEGQQGSYIEIPYGRSPVVNYGYYDDSACLVDSDGDISNFWDVVNSYGITLALKNFLISLSVPQHPRYVSSAARW